MPRELDINVQEHECAGGEYRELVGRTPDLVVEIMDYLLKKHANDEIAINLLLRLRGRTAPC